MIKKTFIIPLLLLTIPGLTGMGPVSAATHQLKLKIGKQRHYTPPRSQTPDTVNVSLHSVIVRYKEPQTTSRLNSTGNSGATDFIVSQKRLMDITPLITGKMAASGLSTTEMLRRAYGKMTDTRKKLFNTYVLTLRESANIDDVLARLRKDPSVAYAEKNHVYQTSFVPDDPDYAQQWSHQVTNAEAGWDITRGDPKIVVAVLDTGVAYEHPDLKDNIWQSQDGHPGRDFVDINLDDYTPFGLEPVDDEDYADIDDDPADYLGHGTHCAGIIGAASNTTGVVGVGHFLKIMPVRIGFCLKYAGGDFYTGLMENDDIVQGIQYAVDSGARVISMSFGGFEPSQAIQEALDFATENNVILVAAAGNEGQSYPDYPGAFQNVIAVGATDPSDNRALFSNFGSWVDVAAPGVEILSTVPSIGPYATPDGVNFMSGTSMACPYVAGLAGLVLSRNDAVTPAQMRIVLKTAADPLADSTHPFPTPHPVYVGSGRVNVADTLAVDVSADTDAYAAIDSPGSFRLVYEDRVPVKGTALGDSYTLEVSDNPYAGEWRQIASGAQVENGVLGVLEPGSLNSQYAYIRLTVMSEGLSDSTQAGITVFDRKAGWPKFTSSVNMSAPIAEDLDNDGEKEVIMTCPYNFMTDNGYLFVMHADGQLKWGKTYHFGTGGNAAIGDLDGDGQDEIIVPGVEQVFAYHADGTLMNGWPRDILTYNSPTISDIDGDGKAEVIISGTDDPQSIFNKIFVLQQDGSFYPGWPLDIIGTGDTAVADLDSDGFAEIIFGTSDTEVYSFPEMCHTQTQLYVMRHIGTPFSENWPQAIQGQMATAPVIGDIDGDGAFEIVAKTAGGLFAFNMDGSPESGNWPMLFEDTLFPMSFMAPVLADLNNDGSRDILFNTGTDNGDVDWLAVDHTAATMPGWPYVPQKPVTMQNFNPAVGDIDGDGAPEIIVPVTELDQVQKDKLLILSGDGQEKTDLCRPMDNHQWQLFSGIGHSPLITDLNGNGKIDILCSAAYGNIYVFEYDADLDPENIQWATLGFDFSRTHTVTAASSGTADLEMYIADWGSGFQGDIYIVNTGANPIENWELAFDWSAGVGTIWNAALKEHTGNHYVITGPRWDNTIMPGEGVNFGFIGSPGNLTEMPENFTVNNEPVNCRFPNRK